MNTIPTSINIFNLKKKTHKCLLILALLLVSCQSLPVKTAEQVDMAKRRGTQKP